MSGYQRFPGYFLRNLVCCYLKTQTQQFLQLQILCFCSNISRKYLLGTSRNKASLTSAVESNLWNQVPISYVHLDKETRTKEGHQVVFRPGHKIFFPCMSGLGFRIMNPGEILLSVFTHSLLDRDGWEFNFSEFLSKLY